MAPKGQDILFSEDRVQLGRNFCNKLWNASRFRQMSGPAGDNSSVAAILKRINPSALDADDQAILARLAETTDATTRALEAHEFTEYTQALYGFFWGDFCDWYVEVSKSRLTDAQAKDSCLAVQDLVLRQFLLLFHPVAPFITEELWHLLGYGPEGDFIQGHNPGSASDLLGAFKKHGIELNPQSIQSIVSLRALVAGLRLLKANANQGSRKDSIVTFIPKNAAGRALAEANKDKIQKLGGLAELRFADNTQGRPGEITEVGTLLIEVSGNVDAGAERVRLTKELEKFEKAVAAGESKLTNETFVSKAPPAILEGARKQLAESKAKRDEIVRMLAALN